ncbi:MAG: DUF1045 domain-containing protein, partial [Paracoccaceae bacterium]
MKRYAVYYSPREGAFASRAAAWLGPDDVSGHGGDLPAFAGLPVPWANLTAEPRRYGFHGTIRAPFRLAEGCRPDTITAAVSALARYLPPVRCDGLRLENLEGFLALTPEGCEAALLDLGARVVEATNDLRAPLTPDEIARRKPARLTQRQRDLMDLWGYPYVMEEFQFHLTLTSQLPRTIADEVG